MAFNGAQPSLPCFVDATPSKVAGISGQGGFAFSLPAPRPIFEAEFLASFHGIGMYRPISNNIHLIGDDLEFFFVSREVDLVIYFLTKF